jgi:hypothetical protein
MAQEIHFGRDLVSVGQALEWGHRESAADLREIDPVIVESGLRSANG